MEGEKKKYINYERKYIADIKAHSRKLYDCDYDIIFFIFTNKP